MHQNGMVMYRSIIWMACNGSICNKMVVVFDLAIHFGNVNWILDDVLFMGIDLMLMMPGKVLNEQCFTKWSWTLSSTVSTTRPLQN